MEIYIQKLGSQSPINEQQVLQLLETLELSIDDLACVRGMQEWKPLWTLPNLPPLVKEIWALDTFLKAVHSNLQIWQMYEDNLLLRKQFENKVDEWEKSVNEFNSKYPNNSVGLGGKGWLFFYQAILKIKSNAFMILSTENNPIAGMVTSLQNQNAYEVLELFDKAIEIKDKPEFHLLKFEPLLYLRKFEEAKAEIEYVLENFDDEKAYAEALEKREILNEIENEFY